mmetsp:Transcript_376/g.518  ORF Transcript_376/g.518 Transcript_376/m.518 type:complete len:151 (-) Transcript_376:32-484(-)
MAAALYPVTGMGVVFLRGDPETLTVWWGGDCSMNLATGFVFDACCCISKSRTGRVAIACRDFVTLEVGREESAILVREEAVVGGLFDLAAGEGLCFHVLPPAALSELAGLRNVDIPWKLAEKLHDANNKQIFANDGDGNSNTSWLCLIFF